MDIAFPPNDPHLKVLLCDDDAMTARLLASELRRHNQFQVIDCQRDVSCILDIIAKNAPNIVLFRTESREASSAYLPLLRRIRSHHSKTRTIALADGSARELVAELFRAGVKGIFDRSDYNFECLCRCILCVASGQIWANSEQLGFVLDVFAETPPLRVVNTNGEQLLTKREKDVVRLVAEGLGNRDIAQELNLSIHTVKNYLFNIFEKLGISNRAELIMYVLSNDHDLLRPENEVQPQPAKIPSRREAYLPEQRMVAVAERF
jgi:DNA-binding NarL/FixJ family response regulator